MSETCGTTCRAPEDGARDLGSVEVFPDREDYGSSQPSTIATGDIATTTIASTTEGAKDEAKATG